MANMTSFAPPSPTAPTCRASRRSGSAAASIFATQLVRARQSAACLRTERRRIGRRDADCRLQPAAGRDQLHTKLLKNDPRGAKRSRSALVGNNLLNDDIRNAVSYTKDEVLMPGLGVRLFANVKY